MPDTEGHLLKEMSGTGKSMETDGRWVVTRAWGVGGRGRTRGCLLNGDRVFC